MDEVQGNKTNCDTHSSKNFQERIVFWFEMCDIFIMSSAM